MWLIPLKPPCESSPSAPASVASSKALAEQCLPEWWVMSSGKPTQRPSSWRGWKTRPWIVRLFGLETSESWTPDLCAATPISSAAAILASHSHRPGNGRGTRMTVTYGPTSPGSLGRWDPHLCSWRMSQGTFAWDSIKCSVTLPRSGTMRSGQLSGRPILGLDPLTGVSACSASLNWRTPSARDGKGTTQDSGLLKQRAERGHQTNLNDQASQVTQAWPTPTGMDGLRTGKEEDYEAWMIARDRHAERGVNKHFHLNAAVSKWPTPTAGDAKSAGSRNAPGSRANKGVSLTDAVMTGDSMGRQWPTPSGSSPNDRETPETWLARQARLKAKGYNSNGAGMPLTIASKLWPTPSGLGGGQSSRGGARQGERLLGGEARDWPTPRACEGTNPPMGQDPGHQGLTHRAKNWIGPLDPMETGAESPSGYGPHWRTPHGSPSALRGPGSDAQIRKAGGHTVHLQDQVFTVTGKNKQRRLSATFVEWLMGLPIGWTDCGV
jgi:hypothetical protein